MAFLAIFPTRMSKARIRTGSADLSPMLPRAVAAAARTSSGSKGFSTILLSVDTALESFRFPKAAAAFNRTSAFSSVSAVRRDAEARSSLSAPSEAAAPARMDFISLLFSRTSINGSTARRSLKPPRDSAARLRTT